LAGFQNLGGCLCQLAAAEAAQRAEEAACLAAEEAPPQSCAAEKEQEDKAGKKSRKKEKKRAMRASMALPEADDEPLTPDDVLPEGCLVALLLKAPTTQVWLSVAR
jgi:hypothetical protein